MKDQEISRLSQGAELVRKGSGLLAVAALVFKVALSQNQLAVSVVLPLIAVLLATLACFLFIASITRVEQALRGEQILPRWAEVVLGLAGGFIIALAMYSLATSVLP